MKAATAIALAGSALLAGCAVGPNYQAPKASVPAQWASSLAGGETNGPAELAAWWRGFGDTNLDLLITFGGSIQSHRFALPKPMCAKPAPNGMWRSAGYGLRSGVRHPIPVIVGLKTANFALPPGTRWTTIFTMPASMRRGSSTFLAARGEPWRPPGLKLASPRLANAAC